MRTLTFIFLILAGGAVFAQPQPVPLKVTTITGIQSAATVIDNRDQITRQNDMHTFCATGSGTWTVQLQYSTASTGPWVSFTDISSSVSNASSNCIGGAVGYHPYLRFLFTGTAVVTYSGVSRFYIPTVVSQAALTFSSPLVNTTGTITCPTCVVTSGSYADPAWITSLTYTKLTSVPGNLTALAALSTGIPAITGSGTASARTITGTANEISVSNGNGVSGNPTLSLPATVDLTSKIFRPPNSTTLPATCTVNDFYVDSDATSHQRAYLCESTNTWVTIGGTGGAPVVVPSTGPASAPVFTCPAGVGFILFTHTLTANPTPSISNCTTPGTIFYLRWEEDVVGGWNFTYGVTPLPGHRIYTAAGGITMEGFIVSAAGAAESLGSVSTNYSGAPVIVSEVTGNVITVPDVTDTLVNLQSSQTLLNKRLGIGTNFIYPVVISDSPVSVVTPGAALSYFYVDPTAKNMFQKNSDGNVNHGIRTSACGAGNHVSATNDDGTVTCSADSGGGGSSGALTATGTVNFTSIGDGLCQNQTMTATGFTTGMAVTIGAPAALESGLEVFGFITASDVATFRGCNHSGSALDPASATYRITQAGYFSTTGTVNFTSIGDGLCQNQTMTATGFSTGQSVAIGPPAALESGLSVIGFISATDTATFRACNYTGAPLDPASATYRITLN